MSIILDPSKNFVAIQIMYIEEVDEKHSSSKFRFINSREEFDRWKAKGYVTSDEFEKNNLEPEKKTEAGMPQPSKPDPNKVIQILRTWWSRMTWKEQNIIYSKCLRQSTDSEGKTKTDLDMILYRDMKLKTCLKRWDLKDGVNEVSVNENIIDSLFPEVAQELLSNFEKVTEAGDEELGE